MNLWDEIKESFREGSALTRLIYINLGVFLLIRIVNVFFVVYFLKDEKISFLHNYENWPSVFGQFP